MVQILTKSCPRVRGKWHGEAMTKGERLEAAKCREVSPLRQSALRRIASSLDREPFGALYKLTY